MADRQTLTALSRKLADQGKLVEAGWIAMRIQLIPLDAPAGQLNDMRLAYMSGAQHLFASVMVIMDEDRDPTEADLRRMDMINEELNAFTEELKRKVKPHADGSGNRV